MRSRREDVAVTGRALILPMVVTLALTLAPPAGTLSRAEALQAETLQGGAPATGAEPANPPDPAAIKAALDALRADPDLGPERAIRTLRWGRAPQPAEPVLPGWLRWVRDFVAWLDQSARYLVWVAVGIAAMLLVAWLLRVTRESTVFDPGAGPFVAPTHVRDVDIRPESLPADIGAAARALWDAGDPRAALALLYRGLLSRLVHVHRVAIKISSTEGDCLALAREQAGSGVVAYATRLVRAWQQAVYGHRPTDPATLLALCDEFAGALDHPAPGTIAAAGTPAVEERA